MAITLQGGISLLLSGWNTAADGSGSFYAIGSIFVMGATNVTLYAQWQVLRGTGPAGGLIFYDKGSYSDGWRYLEAAPYDQSSDLTWGTTISIVQAVYLQELCNNLVIGSFRKLKVFCTKGAHRAPLVFYKLFKFPGSDHNAVHWFIQRPLSSLPQYRGYYDNVHPPVK